jgi:hypothetical protein
LAVSGAMSFSQGAIVRPGDHPAHRLKAKGPMKVLPPGSIPLRAPRALAGIRNAFFWRVAISVRQGLRLSAAVHHTTPSLRNRFRVSPSRGTASTKATRHFSVSRALLCKFM